MTKSFFKKELFKLPKWVKPELAVSIYWLHLAIIAFTVLLILQIWTGGEMLTLSNVLVSVPLLAIGDFFAHTLLKLD